MERSVHLRSLRKLLRLAASLLLLLFFLSLQQSVHGISRRAKQARTAPIPGTCIDCRMHSGGAPCA